MERDGEPDTLDRPLPKYEEVLLQNLKHDMRDVELVKVRRCGVWDERVEADEGLAAVRTSFSH